MILRAISTPQEFRDRAGPFLAEREAENNLILGNLTGLLQGAPGEPPLLLTVEEDDKVIGAAMRTPPRGLVLTRAPAVAIALIADFIARQRIVLPGILAPAESAQTFLTAWKKLSPRTKVALKPHRGYVCDHVVPPPPAEGRFDIARPGDLERLAAMRQAFVEEIGEATPGEDHRTLVENAIQEGSLFVWRNPAIVSMALWTGLTSHGVRIAFVFTPPEHRGRGYATNVTAALTQRLLSEGRRFCFLFTVTANPTSNRIYPAIGYRPHADYILAGFS